jgi:AcrR family transcriptional regulator
MTRPAPPRSTQAVKPKKRRGPLDETVVFAMALRVLEDEGVDRLSLARVAGRLGVTQPALYRHVGSYGALLRGLALEGRRRLLAAITDAAVAQTKDEAVRSVATAWRTFVAEHPHLYAVTDRSTLAGDDDNEAAAAAIVGVLTRVITSYGLSDSAAEQAAWALRSALHGFVTLEADGGYPSTLDIDATFDRFVALVIAGVRHWSDE